MERWVWIKGYRGLYKVSTFGRVKSYWFGKIKIMKPDQDEKFGYLRVVLYRKGKRKRRLVQHLVLEAFVGPCPPGMECRHFPDRDPSNNRLENLSWASRKINMQDKIGHETHQRGERDGMAKLSNRQVRKIRKLLKFGLRQIDIASRFGIVQSHVSRIKRWTSRKYG